MPLVECVPNFSEGRRPEVIARIRDAVAGIAGAVILDVSSDTSHNRTVLTFVAPPDVVADAALAGIRTARELIDLTQHQGEHPRMGATDVVPFVPLDGVTMDTCISLAKNLGERVGRELGIPVFLYERAATRPEYENLADVRRGEFEGLRDKMKAPDFGPAAVHPTAGATAIGARPFLVAYNVYLGPASNLSVAKDVAKAVRGSSGGLRYVKGLGLEVDAQAQVSMNLVDIDKTPLFRAYETVKTEAAAHGVVPTWSEIVGLVPERALLDAGVRHVQLRGFDADKQVLERRVRGATSGGPTIADFIASVAGPSPTPGGGSVVAHVGALAGALVQMVAGLTAGRPKYADVDAEMRKVAAEAAEVTRELSALVERDAASYNAVSAAYKMSKTDPTREGAIIKGLIGAAEVPLETARVAARAAVLAAIVAEKGNTNAVSDAGVAALLAQAACRGAAYNVRINVAALPDRTAGQHLVSAANEVVQVAATAAMRATAAVEKHL